MMTRLQMIAEIRDKFDALNEAGRHAVLRELMRDYDRFNFSGVPDGEICRLWTAMMSTPQLDNRA